MFIMFPFLLIEAVSAVSFISNNNNNYNAQMPIVDSLTWDILNLYNTYYFFKYNNCRCYNIIIIA